jgi:glycosyltransferase involved in cell wall biosynthesis
MTPSITVVLPVRNGARWLGEALASVTGQSLSEWELLAIDDGSADATPAILAEFAGRDPRIRPIRQEALGLVAALNRGLAEARGPLLARLDADDRALPERFARQARHLEENPDVGLLGSWANRIDEQGRPRGRIAPATDPEELARVLMRANPFVHSSVMLRVELARRLGGFRPAFRAAEDYDLWLRVAETAKTANLPEPLVDYRWHEENVTHRNAIRQAFSVRLAQRAALGRRQSGRDPAEGLTEPPDWNATAAQASFYAADAALYRLLELAAPSTEIHADADFTLLAERFAELNHAERALAAHAMIHHMRSADRASARRTRKVFVSLLMKKPGMVPKAAWPLLPGALLR